MSSDTIKRLTGKVQEDRVPVSSASQRRSELERMLRVLGQVTPDDVKDPEIAALVRELILKVREKSAGVKGDPKPVEGAMLLTPAQLKSLVTRATGLANWSLGKMDEASADVAMDQLESEYDLKVDPKTAKLISLSRNTDNRSELFYFGFVLFPGHVYMSDWGTDRVSGGGDVYKTVSALESDLRGL